MNTNNESALCSVQIRVADLATKARSGKCRLCLAESAEIRRSHVVPASVYRLLRQEQPGKNPNPWLITAKRELQTSEQEVSYLFCPTCEHKFSSLGERWTMRFGRRRNGRSKIADWLKQAETWRDPRTSSFVCYAASVPELKVEQLAHFATGIMWRASQHTRGVSNVKLGPYTEAFRRYLNEEEPFPKEAVLNVCSRPESELSETVCMPATVRVDNAHVTSFVMPGLAFHLFVGQMMPAYARKFCILRSTGNPILVSRSLEGSLKKNMIDTLRELASQHSRSTRTSGHMVSKL